MRWKLGMRHHHPETMGGRVQCPPSASYRERRTDGQTQPYHAHSGHGISLITLEKPVPSLESTADGCMVPAPGDFNPGMPRAPSEPPPPGRECGSLALQNGCRGS